MAECIATVEITANEYKNLIKDSENLRVLKNFIKNDRVITKTDLITLVDSMEVNE